MLSLDTKTIMTEFITLAGLDADEARAYEGLVIEAKKKTECLADESRVSEHDTMSLEHLAACEAVYEYALSRCSGDRTIVTSDGKAGERFDSMSRVSAADLLRQEAYHRVRSLMKDTDFVFSLTDG